MLETYTTFSKEVKLDHVEEGHVVVMSSKASGSLDGSSHSTTDCPATLKNHTIYLLSLSLTYKMGIAILLFS